jgi:catalase
MPVEGGATHRDHRVDDDHWERPGDLFRLITPVQRQPLFENTARWVIQSSHRAARYR